MISKTCSMCEIEKHIKIFHKNYVECKDCHSKRGLIRCYVHKNKISNQRKIYYEKNKDKKLQQQTDTFIRFKDLVTSYVELDSWLNTMEKSLKKVFQ